MGDWPEMIVATVKLRGREGKRREILQTISGLTDQIKLMDGCLGVRSYQDIDDRNTFYHVEEWQTQQDLDVYLNSKLFSALLGVGIILVEKPTVEFMTTENVTLDKRDDTQPFMVELKEHNGVSDE